MTKYKDATNNAQRAHAIGEGAGFIYSTRFCKFHGADADFSDDVLDNLLFDSPSGFWSLSTIKTASAISALSAKFGL